VSRRREGSVGQAHMQLETAGGKRQASLLRQERAARGDYQPAPNTAMLKQVLPHARPSRVTRWAGSHGRAPRGKPALSLLRGRHRAQTTRARPSRRRRAWGRARRAACTAVSRKRARTSRTQRSASTLPAGLTQPSQRARPARNMLDPKEAAADACWCLLASRSCHSKPPLVCSR